jgi:hypothetical protein
MSSFKFLNQKWIRFLPALLAGGLLTLLLFRPHGDTFTALDHSGYRLMSVAFSEGRGLHEQDQVLMEAPPEIRHAFLLFPHMNYRNTRDRSFLVHSLERGNTEPFFYPLIPALASGLEKMLPGYGRDVLMPLFGLLFCGLLLAMGYRKGAWVGFLMGLVFCLGSPLPIWLFRGFYIEAAAAALFAWAVYLWMFRSAPVFVASFLAGFSASVHPTFLVLGPPLAVLMMIAPGLRRRQALMALLGLVGGLLPLFMMTAWMAAPYGSLNISHFLANLRVSTPHQLVFAGLLISLLLLGLSLFAQAFRARLCKAMGAPLVRIGISVCAFLPFLWTAFVWSQHSLVQQGLWELWLAIRWPMGLLLPLGIWQLHRSGSSLKPFAIWALFLVTLPLFAYLKGTEQMGMWSQRRLFPAYSLLALALLPVCADLWTRFKPRPWAMVLLSAGLLTCALSNFVRWPAPYLLQVEKGAFREMETIRGRIGSRLAFFDYLPFSFPFAVDNRTRALGFNDQAGDQLEGITAWLSARAAEEEVLIVTAYQNPGLEQGMRLLPGEDFAFEVDRISSKAALPAVKKVSEIDMQFLQVETGGLNDPSLAVDKIFDQGPLALRPPWGNTKRSIVQGQVTLPADWSRQGSGIIGPLPLPGGSVRVRIWATSGRETPQRLWLELPWQHAPVEIEIPVDYQEVEVRIPADPDGSGWPQTGRYRLSSPTPYDPAREGIRGFPPDLGVLIHRIRIERISAGTAIGN